MDGEDKKCDMSSQQFNEEESPGDKNKSNNYQKHKKCAGNNRVSQQPKVPQLELRVFDHPFPYGLSLPSDVIKQASSPNGKYYTPQRKLQNISYL